MLQPLAFSILFLFLCSFAACATTDEPLEQLASTSELKYGRVDLSDGVSDDPNPYYPIFR
jgi:hypothetical protein